MLYHGVEWIILRFISNCPFFVWGIWRKPRCMDLWLWGRRNVLCRLSYRLTNPSSCWWWMLDVQIKYTCHPFYNSRKDKFLTIGGPPLRPKPKGQYGLSSSLSSMPTEGIDSEQMWAENRGLLWFHFIQLHRKPM